MMVAEPANQESVEPKILTPLRLRDLTLKNRIAISPMCMYSATDGLANDFHFVHLGRFALGGAGLVFVEATAVNEVGKITHGCLGLWKDEQIAPLKKIVDFLHANDTAAGIQLSHAGFKAATQRPWEGAGPLTQADIDARGEGPWKTKGVTGNPWGAGWIQPAQMTAEDIQQTVDDFTAAALRANEAGFDAVELHCAHGYLLHSFLSPLSNKRTDEFGGDLEGRMRFPLAVVKAVRQAWPKGKPLSVRISSVDGVGVGWSIDESVEFAKRLKEYGVDIVDCSSGGMELNRHQSLVSRDPGFQVPFAEWIRKEAGIATAAVGLIRNPQMAEDVIAQGKADLVCVAREALFNPNWPNIVALEMLGAAGWDEWPDQFGWWLMRRARQQKDFYGPDRAARP